MPGKEYAFYDKKAQLRQSFPLSWLMMVASILLWVIIFVTVYYAYSLGVLYIHIMQENDLPSPCSQPFDEDSNQNVKKVESYTSGVSNPYIVRMIPKGFPKTSTESVKLPPIVTAVSSSQFYQVQGLIEHLNEVIIPTYQSLRLIIYDVGLYEKEHNLLETYCGCEVRRFITSSYPQHVSDFSNFAWRPIMLQIVLEEHGSLIYLDPSARFKGAGALKMIQNRGWRDYMVWDMPSHVDVIAYTSPGMFEYLEEDRCAFKESGMINMEIMVLFHTNNTWNMLMKPWLKCSFSAECIAPPGARPDFCFHIRRPRTTGCHRYDQSAVSIILNRVAQVTIKRDKYIPPRMTYTTTEEVMLFPKQPWTNTQVTLLVTTPFILWGVVYIFLLTRGKPKFR